VARMVIGELIDQVAITVTAITAFVDPDRVILDGSIGRALAPYLEKIGALVSGAAYRAPELVTSTLGPNATVIGAIASALARHRESNAPAVPSIRSAAGVS
jgi:glucokinase